MSLFKTYTSLTPKTKLALGTGLVAWGLLGLTFADKVESKLGFTPTDADKAELEKMTPKIHVVEKRQDKS
ncbi:hypothetical protein C8A01DRAFT_40235 [Parachaetomium inaequale]|uniref:Uncharacterized protein n=1 Tax=Parachaetomium inaequale TaxID=2588326 RepID=A0AAN6PBH7_9PEZI|nr:hypothetical protein C8A01DRAFT_40235 [Parachaetomium inaequale]